MKNVKPVTTPLGGHFELSKTRPSTKEEKESMAAIPYFSAVRSLIYTMVCTRSDIAHEVGVVSRFVFNFGKDHVKNGSLDI